MYVVDKQALNTLQLSEEDYVIVEDRTYADYVYDAEKLRTFSGKKFHKKKNNYNNYDYISAASAAVSSSGRSRRMQAAAACSRILAVPPPS